MKKHQLIIMRHAKSDWSAGTDTDFERPLTRRGKHDAAQMGAWLTKKGLVPDRVVSSPAVRAKKTALIVCAELGIDRGQITWDERIYEAGVDELLEVIREHAAAARTLLLVGHNPGLDELLLYLSAVRPERNPTGKLMTTAAAAILDYGDEPISAGRKSGRLVELVRPKELAD